jgi:gamma-glutamyltranspeptidase/glutathione hydrolase
MEFLMKLVIRRLVTVTLVALAVHCEAGTPVVTGTGGAAASVSEQATAAALRILNRGGNAVDAAVAAAATLGVTDPFSCGIGGGGFMVIYLAREQRVVTIDHRETAPAAFQLQDFYQDGQPVDFDTAVASGAAVGVPGTVRGWHEALTRYGTLGFAHVLQPAIEVAERGFRVGPAFSALSRENVDKFRRFTSTRALYLRDGQALAPGAIHHNPGLARTYRAIARGGYRAFYEGPLAAAIVNAVTRPPLASGQRAIPGRMSLADLKDYEARIRPPVRYTYRGYELFGMDLPSSGGITVGLALNLLEGFDLRALPRAEAEHLYLEASRRAYADRNAYLGDPEFVQVPVEGLLSKRYAEQRRLGMREARGDVAAQPGDPYPFMQLPSQPLRPAPMATQAEPAHTTHLTVADRRGNVVSYTFTIESWGGSGIVVPGYGFLLNNQLTDFDFTAPHPNAPEPGKRPRSSMAPTIAFRGGRPAFTLGTPGGATIITTVLQAIVNHIDFGMPMEQALEAPRISQRNQGASDVEPGFAGSAQAQALAGLGHRWSDRPEEIGAASALVFNADGSITAVAEARRHGGGSAMVQRPRRKAD